MDRNFLTFLRMVSPPASYPTGKTGYCRGSNAVLDKDKNLHESRAPWRGWTILHQPGSRNGTLCYRHALPCGIRIPGSSFYADNQEDWMGSPVHVEQGDFTVPPLPESPMSLKVEDIYYRVNPRLTQPGKNPSSWKISDEAPTPPSSWRRTTRQCEGVEGVVSSWSMSRK